MHAYSIDSVLVFSFFIYNEFNIQIAHYIAIHMLSYVQQKKNNNDFDEDNHTTTATTTTTVTSN